VRIDPNRGADVDANPILNRTQAVWLNETDSQRAEIVRRYRLFSYQPDEMITFSALRNMRPAQLDLDPRLYQYGGFWIYPVGAMVKAASILHLVQVGDFEFYLDHPEAFGRIYVVARAWCVMWGLVGVWCVFWLAQRITASTNAAVIAAVVFIFM